MLPLLIPAITGGINALSGIFGGRAAARTTKTSSTTTPTLQPEYKTLADLLRTRAEQRLQSSTDLSGYTANGIGDINQAFAGAQQSSNANLIARGLASSPVAGAVGANYDTARAGNIAQFLNQVPLLQRQFQNEDMTAAQSVLGLGRGTSTTGSAVGPGSTTGNILSSGADLLSYLRGLGIFGANQ